MQQLSIQIQLRNSWWRGTVAVSGYNQQCRSRPRDIPLPKQIEVGRYGANEALGRVFWPSTPSCVYVLTAGRLWGRAEVSAIECGRPSRAVGRGAPRRRVERRRPWLRLRGGMAAPAAGRLPSPMVTVTFPLRARRVTVPAPQSSSRRPRLRNPLPFYASYKFCVLDRNKFPINRSPSTVTVTCNFKLGLGLGSYALFRPWPGHRTP